MKLSEINPQALRMIRADIDAALKPVLEKYGLTTLEAGKASYSSNDFTIKVEGTLDGVKKKEEVTKVSQQYAKMLGLPEDILGKTFSFKGEQYKVQRIDINKPKFPIIAIKLTTNQSYKFPIDVVDLIKKQVV